MALHSTTTTKNVHAVIFIADDIFKRKIHIFFYKNIGSLYFVYTGADAEVRCNNMEESKLYYIRKYTIMT